MDFELAPDLVLLRDTVRRFVDEQLIPAEMEDASGAAGDGRFEALRGQVQAMGLWHLDLPADLGGAGLGMLEACVIEEQIARTKAFASRPRGLAGPMIPSPLHAVSAEQRERILGPAMAEDVSVGIAAASIAAAPDTARPAITARLEGGDVILRGAEQFLSAGRGPDWVVVFATADDDVDCLLVDAALPGVTLSAGAPSLTGGYLWTLRLDGARIPTANRLGAPGDGRRLAHRWVLGDRLLAHGARSVGIATRALEMLSSYAQQRVTFGRPLSRRNVVRAMIADTMIEVEMARLLLYRTASRVDRGEDAWDLSAMVKVAATETATRAIDRAMQVHGGTGLTTELPLEHWFRQLRGARITGGASDALRSGLAGRLAGSA